LTKSNWCAGIDRRRLVKSGAVLAAAQFASLFVIRPRAADSVKIGLDNPLTASYAANGKNELVGCQMASDEINAKGGILSRPVQLIVEDSSTGDAGTAVQKARKLIYSDKVDFLLGNENSPLSLAIAHVSDEKSILQIVPGGHPEAITGVSFPSTTRRRWRRPRLCRADQAIRQEVLLHQPGLPVRPYARTGYDEGCWRARGERVGGDFAPLGSVDFSSYLIKAQAANPDVIIFPVQGDDTLNAMKQAVQFGLPKKMHLAGAPAGAGAANGPVAGSAIGNEAHEVGEELVVTSCDAAEVFQLLEEALHDIALFVEFGVVMTFECPVSFGRNDGLAAGLRDPVA
jgi:branched-chain amino acid transport system substrate-binding protein